MFFSSLSLEKSVIPPALRSAATSLRDRAAFFQSEMMRPANDPKERDPAHVRMLNDVLRDLEKSFISPQSAPGVYRWEDVYSCDGVLLSSVGTVVCLGLTLMCNASKYVIFLHKKSPQRVRQTQLTFWNLEESRVKVGRCKGLMQPRLTVSPSGRDCLLKFLTIWWMEPAVFGQNKWVGKSLQSVWVVLFRKDI